METKVKQPVKSNISKMAIIGVLSAIAYILMFMEFSVPLMPVFIKMDLSDFPALIGSLAVGPVGGVIIALIKNLLHLTVTSTGGVGELSNFILNAVFVLPAGFLYKRKKSKKSACGGAIMGAILMAVFSVVSNYFVVYPVYYNFMPEDTILAAYQAIFPGVKSILQSLIVFNMPFTFVKAMISVVITFLIYNHLVPILTMNKRSE
ncbi:ECF transporter S component [uncultured Eubacterium sp.]|uniref:ECF transporter S component n=1 Tax=uncultured Eubacterium sp. TaxID=165185 RepID=UPI0025E728B6|nr:ECF transporter S component [uncultured Eubacterium sp.]